VKRLLLVPVVGGLAILGLVVLIGSGAAGTPDAPCQSGAGPSAIGEPELVALYIQAAARYGLGADGYAVLAAINKTETGFGTDLATSSAGAVGWMQFEPSTWAKYAVTPSGSVAPDDAAGWNDPVDAIYTAARYLQASGAPGDWSEAIYAYNHARWYVGEIEQQTSKFVGTGGLQTLARLIEEYDAGTRLAAWAEPTGGTSTQAVSAPVGCTPGGAVDAPLTQGAEAKVESTGIADAPADAPETVKEMIAAGNRIIDEPYVFGGGHCVAAMGNQPDPQACGFGGYDCSGSTDYVLWGGGLGQSVLGGSAPASSMLTSLGKPGPGRWVTWYSNPAHAWIIVAGIALDTSNSYVPGVEPAGSGPRWIPAADAEDYELTVGTDHSEYVARHPAGL
jgi:hypothetical protein